MENGQSVRVLSRETTGRPYDWPKFVEALRKGHQRPKALLKDVFVGPRDKTLLSRAAWIDGLGYGVKSVTVVEENGNRNLPTVQGGMLVFDPENGALRGVIDSALVTDIKTAADSALAAKLLARSDARRHLIIGAGAVAYNIALAYRACMPNLSELVLWNRTASKAETLAKQLKHDGIAAEITSDLPDAVARADVISTATMAREPILLGKWVRPGTHVDLVGAFKADMREADDELVQNSRLFVDSYDTTIEHIGEIAIPISIGAIAKTDILADLYALVAGTPGRVDENCTTVFKNGGGAHLDLMVADALLRI